MTDAERITLIGFLGTLQDQHDQGHGQDAIVSSATEILPEYANVTTPTLWEGSVGPWAGSSVVVWPDADLQAARAAWDSMAAQLGRTGAAKIFPGDNAPIDSCISIIQSELDRAGQTGLVATIKSIASKPAVVILGLGLLGWYFWKPKKKGRGRTRRRKSSWW